MLAWDRAARGEHGGAHNPHRDLETGRLTCKLESNPKPDNIRLEVHRPNLGSSDYGTSAQAGPRRLQKAATAGDAQASDLLHRLSPGLPRSAAGLGLPANR